MKKLRQASPKKLGSCFALSTNTQKRQGSHRRVRFFAGVPMPDRGLRGRDADGTLAWATDAS